MKTKSKHGNTEDSTLIWNWKENDFTNKKKNRGKQFPVTEFLQDCYRKMEETVLGPGVGTGIGCGVGAGFGLVGGIGYGGWPWNHLKLVFGVGMGCGIGIGFGYGRGLGYGRSWDSLRSQLDKRKSASGNKGTWRGNINCRFFVYWLSLLIFCYLAVMGLNLLTI